MHFLSPSSILFSWHLSYQFVGCLFVILYCSMLLLVYFSNESIVKIKRTAHRGSAKKCSTQPATGILKLQVVVCHHAIFCLTIVLQLKNCSIHHFKRAIGSCFLYDVVEEVQTLYYYISALPSFGFRVEGYFEKTIARPLCTWIACGKRDSSLIWFYGDDNVCGDFKYPFVDLDKF